MKSYRALINGKRLAFYTWGSASKPPLLLIHGWMDSAACFDAMAEKLSKRHHVVGFDLHGFGRSNHSPFQTGYHFHAHVADVHAVVAHELRAEKITLFGHSMGGNIAAYYTGMFPDRVERLINVEGFGLPDGDATSTVEKFRTWILAVSEQPRARVYKTLDDYLERLAKSAPLAAPVVLKNQARHLVRRKKGGYVLRADVAHFLPEPDVYSAADFDHYVNKIRCPVLLIHGAETAYTWGHELLAHMRKNLQGPVRVEAIFGAGHMMHYEQPEMLAEIVGGWLVGTAK